jgi:hypothetical protein
VNLESAIWRKAAFIAAGSRTLMSSVLGFAMLCDVLDFPLDELLQGTSNNIRQGELLGLCEML